MTGSIILTVLSLIVSLVVSVYLFVVGQPIVASLIFLGPWLSASPAYPLLKQRISGD